MNGLDICSGGGGASLALAHRVRPVAYCESDESAQSVLLERQQKGQIGIAPIWDDLRTLERRHLPVPVHVLYGGTPCQDISVAGGRGGMDGDKSKLIFEVFRLAREFRPVFVFMENSPNIITMGLERILMEFTSLGFDARWTIVSAEDVGAPHLRERFWLLAYSHSNNLWHESITQPRSEGPTFAACSSQAPANAIGDGRTQGRSEFDEPWDSEAFRISRESTDALSAGRQRWLDAAEAWQSLAIGGGGGGGSWPSWLPQPCVGRSNNGLLPRMDRIAIMGNGWVPQAGRAAFEFLLTGRWLG